MSRFGRGLRSRKKAAEADTEVTRIADEANLWWTRRDFVQHAVVITRQPGSVDPAKDAAACAGGPVAGAPGWATPPGTGGHPGGAARSARTDTPPSTPPASHERAADPLAGRSFAEVFTTESLFAEPSAPRGPYAPGAAVNVPTGRPGSAGAAAGTAGLPGRPGAPAGATSTAPRTAPTEPAPELPRLRRRPLAVNHPLIHALGHLDLGREATWADIQLAYRTKAKQAHPDVTGDDGQTMSLLNAAYTELRDGRSYGLFDD
jgi:hypothetical protein